MRQTQKRKSAASSVSSQHALRKQDRNNRDTDIVKARDWAVKQDSEGTRVCLGRHNKRAGCVCCRMSPLGKTNDDYADRFMAAPDEGGLGQPGSAGVPSASAAVVNTQAGGTPALAKVSQTHEFR